jgi:hypothetical protein
MGLGADKQDDDGGNEHPSQDIQDLEVWHQRDIG